MFDESLSPVPFFHRQVFSFPLSTSFKKRMVFPVGAFFVLVLSFCRYLVRPFGPFTCYEVSISDRSFKGKSFLYGEFELFCNSISVDTYVELWGFEFIFICPFMLLANNDCSSTIGNGRIIVYEGICASIGLYCTVSIFIGSCRPRGSYMIQTVINQL
jgi:hypothetical protein